MDFGAPIGQEAAFNPSNAIQTLSGILGVQQQKQALAGQAAEVQQAQQQNTELQALSAFTKSAVQDPKYHNADGSLNVQRFQQDASAVAPVYGQQYIGQATSNANSAIDNRRAILNLSNEQRQTMGQYFGEVAANPNATRDDFMNAVEQARGISDDPLYQKSLDRALMSAPPVRNLSTAQASQAMRDWARGIAVETGAANQNLSQPTANRFTTPSGNIGYAQENPMSPTGMGQWGTQVGQGVAPTIVSGPSGVPTVVKGSTAAPAANAGSGPGPTPTEQDWQNFGAYNSNLNARVSIASDAIPRIQQAEQALAQIRGGHGAQGYASLAQVAQAAHLPQSIVDSIAGGNLAAAQEAEKYLFQTTFSGLRQAMQGDPARVAEFQSAEQVFPSIGTDPRAAQAVLNFMTDQGKRDYAEQQALVKARESGTFNPVTWQASYQQQLRAGKVPGVPGSQIPNAGPQEGAKSTSKSGRPTVWHNGRWEYVGG